MHRKLLIALASVVLALGAAPSPAAADSERRVDVEANGDGFDASVGARSDRGDRPSGSGRVRPRRPVDGPPPTLVATPVLRYDPATAATCLHVAHRVGNPSSTNAQADVGLLLRLSDRHPLCPGSSTRPSAAQVADLVWRTRIPLPNPTVRIQPGRAITGKEAFLEVGGPSTGSWAFSVYGYNLQIGGSSSYEISWGDGAVTNTSSQGGPWPGGDVRHTWTHVCSCTVTVTQHWTGTWQYGPQRGQIRNEAITVGVLSPFPVDQVQAVRNR